MRKGGGLSLLLGLSALEGLAAVVWLLREPSEGGGLILGYSAVRLGAATAVLAAVGGLAALAWRAARSPRLAEELEGRLGPRVWGWGLALLAAAALWAALGWALSRPLSFETTQILARPGDWAPRLYQLGASAFGRFLPLWVWGLAVMVQTLLFLGLRFPAQITAQARAGGLLRGLLAAALLGSVGFHWIVLVFRLETFLRVPGWKWYFYEKPLDSRAWIIFGVLLLGSFALALWAGSRPRLGWAGLLLLAGWAAAAQISFGFIEGGGFESLRVKYADGVFSRYAQAAAAQPSLPQALREYEARYGDDWYLGTKPPGVLLTYIGLERLANAGQPQADRETRFLRLTRLKAYAFPFLAGLSLVLLTLLARRLEALRGEALAALLLFSCPSFLLIPTFLDNALYPLLFLGGLLLAWWGMRRASVEIMFLLGAYIYVCLYLSFSLLPLAALAGGWVALDGWLNRRTRPLTVTLRMLLWLGAGMLVADMAFRWLLDYDIWQRYQTAMLNHRRAKDYVPGLEQTLRSLRLNNTEMLTWSGYPLVILFLANTARTVWTFVRRRAGAADSLLAAAWVTYAALNVGGQTDGEVQRLWLFLVPLVCLYAAREICALCKHPSRAAAWLVGVQLLTALWIFHWQDFYG